MKLFLVVNVDWFFLSHRLPIALEALRRGYAVTILAIDTGCAEKIRSYGFRFIPLPTDRKGLNLIRELRTIRLLHRLYKKEKPEVVHHVALKPVIYGSLAARFLKGTRFVNAISGMGYLFSNAEKQTYLRRMVLMVFKFAFHNTDLRFIFQNKDDRKLIMDLGVLDADQTYIIEGSGIDLNEFTFEPEPASEPVRITYTGRFLSDKGLLELVDAAKTLHKKFGAGVEVCLAGDVDEENRASLSKADLDNWQKEGVIKLLGFRTDIFQVLKDSHIVVLPSYREGLPKSLIEACAVGRAIVTTDVPGCRDVVTNGVNGLVVPARDAAKLASALEYLVINTEERKEMGRKGRRIAEEKFSIQKVLDQTFAIYEGR